MDEWHDPELRPGLSKIDRRYSFIMLAIVILGAVCCYSYQKHWGNVGIVAASALTFLALALAFNASRLAQKDWAETARRLGNMRQNSKQRGIST